MHTYTEQGAGMLGFTHVREHPMTARGRWEWETWGERSQLQGVVILHMQSYMRGWSRATLFGAIGSVHSLGKQYAVALCCAGATCWRHNSKQTDGSFHLYEDNCKLQLGRWNLIQLRGLKKDFSKNWVSDSTPEGWMCSLDKDGWQGISRKGGH